MSATRRARHAEENPTRVIHTENTSSSLAEQQLRLVIHKLYTGHVPAHLPRRRVVHSPCTNLSTGLFGVGHTLCLPSNRPRQCANTYRGLTDHTATDRRLP